MSPEGTFASVARTPADGASSHLSYRPEVDGLRAIAVMAVILFHAKLRGFNGGYIGVDVFFVISGYLITSILIGEHQRGAYSLLRFYERRARRILPALFFVLLCCLPFAWALMTPSQMKGFSQSVVATSAFASNIYFWLSSGYFSTLSEEKPLLHTWSLGVEEQYYIFFPLLLALLWRYGSRRLVATLAFLAVGSFALGIWGAARDASGVFYLAPTRVWQLLAGSLIAFAGISGTSRPLPPLAGNALSLFGLVLILASIHYFGAETPFPSLVSLAPVLGSVLVLAFARQGTLAARILSLRPMVGIGLVSYSAYLWHQPVLAFLRLYEADLHSLAIRLGAVALSLGLAYISWRFVETPFRDRRKFSTRYIFTAAGVGTAVAIAIGMAGYLSKGFSSRFDPQARAVMASAKSSPKRMACHTDGPRYLDPKLACTYFKEPVTWAALGNSHVTEPAYALAQRLESLDQGLLQLSYSGCPPAFTYQAECTEWLHKAVERIETDKSVQNVLVAYRYTSALFGEQTQSYPRIPTHILFRLPGMTPEQSMDAYWASFQAVLERLQGAGKRVFVILPIPELDRSIEEKVWAGNHGAADYTVGTSMDYYRARNAFILGKFRQLPWSDRLVPVDPTTQLCDATRCYAVIDGQAMYFDDHHLSLAGAARVMRLLEPYLK
ncbi:acyltransferase family protein [Solimonas sp. K1W22B-7]|uniref:acyltransferase family protein n=1 Tax=Solimonas sp. K1W22B-7 TaxID=2303331 RepID=UPI0013C4DE8E|nr:acyltransferase family protein [Solimonas sp. K1W22B-7]